MPVATPRHDPEESRRALVEFVTKMAETIPDPVRRQVRLDGIATADDELLRWIAVKYDYHPDYRVEWLP